MLLKKEADNNMDYFNLTADEKSSLDKLITNFEVVPLSNSLNLGDSNIMSSCNYSCSGGCEGSCEGTCKDYCPDTCKGTCKDTCINMCPGGCSGTCRGNCPGYVQSSAENTLDYFNLTTDEKSSLDKLITNFEVVPINNLLDLDNNDIMSSCNASCFSTCEGYCPSTCKGSCGNPDFCGGTCSGYIQNSPENTVDYFELTTDEKSSLDKLITNFEEVPINDLSYINDNYIMSDCNYSCSGGCSGSCEGTCEDFCPGKCIGGCSGSCKGFCPSTCLGTCKNSDGANYSHEITENS